MIHYRTITNLATAKARGLKIQTKSQWRRGLIGAAGANFIHASNVEPERVQTFGLSPEYASEYLLDNSGNQLGEGKMVFSMPEGSSDKAIRLLWGHLQYTYTFTAPVGTIYYSLNGTINNNKEIAFPYIVEASDIIEGLT